MNKYTVFTPANVPKMTLGNYVRKAFPLLTARTIREAFNQRDVKMGGIRCTRETLVRGGTEVTVFTSQTMTIPIIFENGHLLILDKPEGVSADSDAYGAINLPEWAKMYADSAYEPRLCHRIDNRTSGLVALAKDEETERVLKAMFARRDGRKEYLCVVRGHPAEVHADRTAFLLKDPVHARVSIYDGEQNGTKRIETEYEVLESGRVSLLHVLLHTGRTHQIRAHLAHLGFPIVGDDLYGDRTFNKRCSEDHLMLCAARLTFDTKGALPEIDGKTYESIRINELKSAYYKLRNIITD